MNWRTTTIFILVGFALIISLGILAPAAAIEIGQGDVAYMGEMVDISLAVSWPDFAVAWCTGGYYGCQPPTQIIQITGNMHKYYLDPAVWHYGTYYRWDGEWRRGENSVAFTINPGVRPRIPITKNTTVNTTVKTELSASKRTSDEIRQFIIAKGDDVKITTYYNQQYNDTGSLWVFSSLDMIKDLKLNRTDSDYSYQLSSADTGNMEIGKYTGYLHFSGRNHLQDVYYNSEEEALDTPYDDKFVPDVSLRNYIPERVKEKFEVMVRTGTYSDDILVPITMEIVEPSIRITEVLQGEGKMWIGGETTWSEGTPMSLKLDADNYALSEDIAAHSWQTLVTGNLTKIRTFSMTTPLDTDELSIGMHEIKASVNHNYLKNDNYYNFRVSDVYVMPTPTPKIVRVISLPTMVTPEPTPVPTVEYYAPQYPENPPVIAEAGSYVIASIEGEITPVPVAVPVTANITRPSPTRDPNITLPLPWWIGILAMVFISWRIR